MLSHDRSDNVNDDIICSSILKLLLMVQMEPPQAVWFHLTLSRCMVSEVMRLGMQESKIFITPSNVTLLTVFCPPRWCIPQTHPRVSLGWLIQLQFFLLKNVPIYVCWLYWLYYCLYLVSCVECTQICSVSYNFVRAPIQRYILHRWHTAIGFRYTHVYVPHN